MTFLDFADKHATDIFAVASLVIVMVFFFGSEIIDALRRPRKRGGR